MAPLASRKTVASTVLGTVMAATSMFAAAAISFNFADKSQRLDKYAEYASQLIADGQTAEACQYMNQLITAFDEYLANAEKDSGIQLDDSQTRGQRGDNSVVNRQRPHSLQLLLMTRRDHQVLELLEANVLLLAERMSQEQWLETYENTLNTYPDRSAYILNTLLRFPENTFPTGMTDRLRERSLPPEAREMLVLAKMFPRDKTTEAILSELHGKLFEERNDLQSQKSLLRIYIRALRCRRAHREVNQVLGNLIKLFPDTELGIEAARLRRHDD